MRANEKVYFSLLGPFRVWVHDQELVLGPIRQQAVLLSLVRSHNQVVSVSRLLRDVWGEEPPRSGHRTIPPYIYRLRKLVPEGRKCWEGLPIERRREGYVLRAAPEQLDCTEFDRLVRDGQAAQRKGDLETAYALVSQALHMWGEEPLVGLAGPLAQSTRMRLVEQRRMVIEQRIQLAFLMGRHRLVIPELLQHVELDPLYEPMSRLLMVALNTCDRHAEALNVFHETRKRLVEETGMEPGRKLQQTYEAILRADLNPPDDIQGLVAQRRVG
jgi:SARP family transcriptional regulator, regulator of embCAB operon